MDGTYPVTVVGRLTMHGTERDMTAKGTLTVKGGKASVAANFNVLASDYGIKIPSIVGNKVANEVKITVKATLEKLVR